MLKFLCNTYFKKIINNFLPTFKMEVEQNNSNLTICRDIFMNEALKDTQFKTFQQDVLERISESILQVIQGHWK